MPKKEMTPEEKKAWGQKMKQAREAKKTAQKIEASPPSTNNDELDDLKRRIKELESSLTQPHSQHPTPQSSQPQVTGTGIIGTYTKFSINPDDYPDPRERLASEQRLVPQAFKENFLLEWKVGPIRYDTKDGRYIEEPKFDIELWRLERDDVSGELTDRKYRVTKGTFFEDPAAALAVAQEQGLEVPKQVEKLFLDEMRYLRIRDWLFDAFFPPPPQNRMNAKEEVIGNRLVEVVEINSTTPESPMSKIKGKI